jgi:outer membrane receptor protein involved in Fe transport
MLLAWAAGAGWSSPAAGQHPPVLEGRVIDRLSGAPISGALVGSTVAPRRTTSDGAGAFTLRGLEPGPVAIEAQAAGYRPGQVQVELRNGQFAWVRIELDPDPVEVRGIDVAAGSADTGATVLDRAALDDLGPADLGTALEGMPGVVVTRRGGPGAPATASIRGSSPDQVLVLLDGFPMNAPMTGGADLSTITLDGVERVTVIPGAQSARF